MQDAAFLGLTGNLTQEHAIGRQSQRPQYLIVKSRTHELPHRRQLGIIAHEHHLATQAVIHVCNEVLQETAATEDGAVARIADHRCLVNDEDGVGLLVVGQTKGIDAVALLTVNLAVDGVSRVARIFAEDVRSTSRRRHQHRLASLLIQRLYNSTRERCLASTCIATQNKHRPLGSVQ